MSPSNVLAATSRWRVLSEQARWNSQCTLQPLCQKSSSVLCCPPYAAWFRSTFREPSPTPPAGLSCGLGGTMLESIRVTGECRQGRPRWHGCSGWRPLGSGLGGSGAIVHPEPCSREGCTVPFLLSVTNRGRELCGLDYNPIPKCFRCVVRCCIFLNVQKKKKNQLWRHLYIVLCVCFVCVYS